MVGIVKGYKTGHNIDGDIDRVLLQVEVLKDEDVRTIELFAGFGVDTIPAVGCRVEITDAADGYQITGIISDDLESEVDAGEKEIYSTDDPVTTKKARIKFDKTGNVIINEGANHATQQEALQSLINIFLVALNGQLTGLGGAGGLTLDITTARVTTVKLP